MLKQILIDENKLSNSFEIDESIVILNEITDIHQQINVNEIIYLLFEKNVGFINPLFLIVLFNQYEKLSEIKKYRLVLDITNLPNDSQHALMIHTQQYADYKLLYNQYKTYFDGNINRPKISDFKDYVGSLIDSSRKIVIDYATKTVHNEIKLYKTNQYKHLPLTKITNRKHELFSNDSDDLRFLYYYGLSLESEKSFWEESSNLENEEDIWNIIFRQYLDLYSIENESIIKSIKNILIEVTNNIKKHTEVNGKLANGYLSFYKKNITKDNFLNEFIVCDDFEEGFLETYYKTMIDERSKEEDSIALEEYDEIIELFKKEENEKVLEKIFNLEYIFKIQRQRIKKHFGLPLLLKLLNEMNSSQFDNLISLKFYVHRGNNCYLVNISKSGTNVSKLENIKFKGTYIYLSFPTNIQIENSFSHREPLDLHTTYYKEVYQHIELIEEKIKNFKYMNFDEFKECKSFSKNESLIIKYIKEYNVSDFLRTVYTKAYIFEKSILDIVITNFNIEFYLKYLEIYRETALLETITNIIFIDYKYPIAMFIGGKSEEQMGLVNYKLSNSYNYDKVNFIADKCEFTTSDNILFNTNLFYESEENNFFIPLDLFIIDSNTEQYLYADMINNLLEDSKYKKSYHVDICDGYHVSQFYFLKYIFEDSTWINRFAFNLARYLEKNTVLIGVQNYSTLIVNKSIEIFSETLKSYIIYDLEDIKEFDIFISNVKHEDLLIFCPVITNSEKLQPFTKNIDNKKYCAIKLEYMGNKEFNDYRRFLLKNVDKYVQSAEKCSHCFNDLKEEYKPLYNLDKDSFTIKNIYTDEIKIDSTIETIQLAEENTISWKNSIYFGHTTSCTNHYLYYIKTIQFLRSNELEISKSYKKVYEENKEEFGNNQIIYVILSPLHSTNNEFISLIDKYVFKNNAVIHYFNLSNKKQNYQIIDSLKNKYSNSEKYKFYFVDDEISSGNTLEYFSKLLKSITQNMTKNFSGVFSLLNRTSGYDRELLNNYCESQQFYIYKNLNLTPIKTNFENCYLCERKEYFKDLSIDSSLVFIKNQFAEQVEKLSINDSDKLEYELIDDLNDFKNYLKMYATEYINNNLYHFDNIEIQLSSYKRNVKEYFIRVYLGNETDEIINIFIDEMLSLEADIAFVKALYFPNISYYQKIKSLIFEYVVNKLLELRDKTFDIHNKSIKVIPIFQKTNFNILKEHILFKNIRVFVGEYMLNKKCNINQLNFYIITSAYLRNNHILTSEMINLYFYLSRYVKENKLDIKLLHKYPVAVKMLVSYSKEKSKYFNFQLRDFFKIKDTISNKIIHKIENLKDYSLINALFIENNGLVEGRINLTISDSSLETKIDYFKSQLLDYIGSIKEFNSIDCYIDINPIKEKIELANIFNNYKSLELEENNKEYLIYNGVSSKESFDSDKICINEDIEKTNLNNIWCNYYDSNEGKTIIRITHTERETLAFKPISVLVIKHAKEFSIHLQLVRDILKIQEEISKFIVNEILPGAIDDKKNRVLSEYLNTYNHNVGTMLELTEDIDRTLIDNTLLEEFITHGFEKLSFEKNKIQYLLDNINNLKAYTYGLPFIAKAAQLGYKKNKATIDNNVDFFNTVRKMKDKIENFFKVAAIFNTKTNIKNNGITYKIEVDDNIDSVIIKNALKQDIQGVIFEICYNAAKYNNLSPNSECIIKFYTYNGNIYIENNICEKDIHSTSKVGLLSITKYLNKLNYDLETECFETKYVVKILKRS
ncbi:hypothetical protein AF79_07325 [Aliarcobacter butzleri L354]|uniref:hypothetical protein n=1 Tax=Aliarcobacter butzleri TaxID=28197 RepID=UPI00063AE180|nr:hypothetical protein [Aliarcobacter butzleri]KLE08928.1 hypothetical protein AF79_07325 [Aliarcobacter butzleri L354]